jgi:large subunit ribosomal protein L35
MTKLKVRKAAKKRYKQIGLKKFIRKKAFKGHILEKKSPKRKRNLSNSILVTSHDSKAIRRMLVC